MSDTVAVEDDPRRTMQPGGVWVSFSVEIRNAVEEIGVFALLRELYYDSVYRYVAFKRTEEVH